MNPNLPKIVDISWTHGQKIEWNQFVNDFPLTVYFDREMTGIDRQTFKVWIDYPGCFITRSEGDVNNVTVSGLYNLTNLSSNFSSTSFESIRTLALDLLGTPRSEFVTGITPRNISYKSAVKFNLYRENQNFPSLELIKAILTPTWIASSKNENFLKFFDLPCVHILLKGDFIKTRDTFDENGVLDADNIGGQVGAIGANRNSGNSTQGGYFESWFFLEPPKDQEISTILAKDLKALTDKLFNPN